MQAPGGPEEDPTGGFEHGGWSAGYWDEPMESGHGGVDVKPFDLVLGRRTYEIFAAHWPHADDPGAELLNAATKHVASTTRKRARVGELEADRGRGPRGGRARSRRRTAPSFRCTAART